MDRAAELEPSRPLGGKPNDGVLPGIEIRAFDASSMRNDSVSFDLSQMALEHHGTKIVPNMVLVRDRHHDRHSGHQREAGGYKCRVLNRDLDLLLALPLRRGQCQSEKR